MYVKVEEAKERPGEYYFRITVNSDLPPDQQSEVEFTYGKDMPLAQIRDEIVALLTNDFGAHPVVTLPWEGAEVEIS